MDNFEYIGASGDLKGGTLFDDNKNELFMLHLINFIFNGKYIMFQLFISLECD